MYPLVSKYEKTQGTGDATRKRCDKKFSSMSVLKEGVRKM